MSRYENGTGWVIVYVAVSMLIWAVLWVLVDVALWVIL